MNRFTIIRKRKHIMAIHTEKVGAQIAMLRKNMGLTQNELGERLGVSYQAVSKWERGETVPDVGILLDLAGILRTTVDNILSGGEKIMEYRGKITVAEVREAMACLRTMGEKLGEDNLLYAAAIEGINTKLNTTVEEAFRSEHIFEVFVSEALLSCIRNGYYVDLTDIKNNIKNEKLCEFDLDFAEKHGMK